MNMQKRKETQSALLMILTSVIWGFALVFQRTGMEFIGPFAFNFFRCLLSLVFLLLVSTTFKIRNKRKGYKVDKSEFSSKSLIIGGILAGIALFLAMSTQQVGMISTTASKAGFITTMYIVLVPIMGIFYGRKTTPKMWLCVAIACVGIYMLSIKEGFVIEKGDLLVFISAIFFALQIVIIDIFAPRVDAIKLSMVEFMTSGLLSLVATLATETTTILGVKAAFVAILYTGLLSSGVGFTLQIVAQKNLPPTITSLIMSMEAGVSAVAGVLFLGEILSSREIVGCMIMVISVLIAQVQLPLRKSKEIEDEFDQNTENRKIAQ
ncbi:MAG: DMT family transporter [Peptostreptococcus sp.]|uniref:DMT family transporter n=1 Tax=Peptostreptococcus sp. TaxID=1262 RepID=UPI002FC97629